jgi:hypothetical protein
MQDYTYLCSCTFGLVLLATVLSRTVRQAPFTLVFVAASHKCQCSCSFPQRPGLCYIYIGSEGTMFHTQGAYLLRGCSPYQSLCLSYDASINQWVIIHFPSSYSQYQLFFLPLATMRNDLVTMYVPPCGYGNHGA